MKHLLVIKSTLIDTIQTDEFWQILGTIGIISSILISFYKSTH